VSYCEELGGVTHRGMMGLVSWVHFVLLHSQPIPMIFPSLSQYVIPHGLLSLNTPIYFLPSLNVKSSLTTKFHLFKA